MPQHQHQQHQHQHQHQQQQQQQQQHQYRPAPTRTTSVDGWHARAPPRPQFVQPNYTPAMNSQVSYNQHQGTPSSTAYTPKSTDLGQSYFSPGATPDIREATDFWDEAVNLDRPVKKNVQFDDFGLGLEPLGTDLNAMIINTSNANAFPYPAVLTEVEPFTFDPGSPEGRSWSSISDSSGGLVTEFPELSSTAETTCLNLDAMMPGLESVLSSRHGSTELPQSRFANPASRGVADSPRSRYRSSPYAIAPCRSRSLSTGSVALSGPQRSSVFAHGASPSMGFEPHQTFHPSGANSMSVIPDMDFELFCQSQTPNFPGAPFDHHGLFVPPSAEEPNGSSVHTPPEMVNVLQSSSPARTKCEHHFAGSSRPPDLFGPLQDDQLSPPPEDMEGEGAEIPRAQELRFDGDLYTPKYVRGHGNKREGWCGICKPGRWLVLKNSAYWYDKSFTHGISAATGSAFEGPQQTRRMKGNPDVWEGLCHSCEDWIALISSKKKGTTWFRHAYKCHTHQKVKDTSKRRREVSHAKGTKASKSRPTPSATRDGSPNSLDSAMASLDEDMPPQPECISALDSISTII
ncbi:hypothetical protein MMC07_003738 [Pseudocyphellaria aurata]|nr:hypothetical protein [Pseudocyphellaria aurata]